MVHHTNAIRKEATSDKDPGKEDTPPTGDDGDFSDSYRTYLDKDEKMGGQSTGKNGHKEEK